MAIFPSIRIEGSLFGPETLDQIMSGDLPGQKPADFGLDPKRSLTDEIAAIFAISKNHWLSFKGTLARLPEDDLATTETRKAWIDPLLLQFGYNTTLNPRSGVEVDGHTFEISHRAGEAEDAPPVHIVGARQELGRVPRSGRPRLAPHSLLQEFLNRDDHTWGIVTNGLTLRLLRDSTLIRRQVYVEFDLQAIFEEQRFNDFAALYRLLHRTRLPRGKSDASDCLLERYHAQSVEQGGRVRERLREGVEECLKLLANGFLAHPRSAELRAQLREGRLTAADFYRQLLRIVYRLLFLLVSEERGLISANPLYREHYGIARLRRMLDVRAAYNEHTDLWLSLRALFRVFQKDDLAAILEVAPLNGDLFEETALDNSVLTNRDLLQAFWRLSYYQERGGAPPRRVNYGALDVEELGSVYESLLDFHPDVDTRAAESLRFDLIAGSDRKTTGSYYTPPELVNELVESALVPVMNGRLQSTEPSRRRESSNPAAREQALLGIKIVDPACGSGHMLLAAARRLGKEVAKARTGEDEPAPERVREAIRDVISHCIYGVDKNPLAVDLCRVALWLESHTTGKPLSFLDHRIRCGDSLVGVFDLQALQAGIPEGAFSPVSGDDKRLATAYRNRNREELDPVQLDFHAQFNPATELGNLAAGAEDLDAMDGDSVEGIHRKAARFARFQTESERVRRACDLWTAAFFAHLDQSHSAANQIPTTAALREVMERGQAVEARLNAEVLRLRERQNFFHWPLAFPEVFAHGGFDVILSNPPWEMINLMEQEFFEGRDPRIARAPGAARKRLIEELKESNPVLFEEFTLGKHDADCLGKFVRHSGRFPLTAVGKINTYAVFAETVRNLLGAAGRAGVILPTGIATDDTTKRFFSALVENQELAQLWGFENEEFLFPAVHHAFKFCALILGRTDAPMDRTHLAFYVRNFDQLKDDRYIFELSPADFRLLNPNTGTCPVFRSKADAELTRLIYQRVPVLVREGDAGGNPWGISFSQGLFNMTSDSELFDENVERAMDAEWLPLYEAKMMWQFDHRFSTYEGATQQQLNVGILPQPTAQQKADPAFQVRPRYWVPRAEVIRRLASPTPEEKEALANGELTEADLLRRLADRAPKWLLGFRDITNATNERTAIFSVSPLAGVGHTMPLLFSNEAPELGLSLIANLNSLVLDFVARQKLGGTHLTYSYLKQFPLLPPTAYPNDHLTFVLPIVLELVYTSRDMEPLAEAIRQSGLPFAREIPNEPYRWNEERRALLRAELDAWFARAYGLSRKQLRYILDPADLTPRELENILDPWEEVTDPLDPAGYTQRAAASDYPSETFRVLKEKELARHGEYRTRRLVLEAWGRLPEQPR
ncbi:MAG TPA: N-6 DNA methylase [Methylomirabilota bacterium]|nr:N-6 DNA methylase [Methylomirabilota bacterium]